MKRFICKLLVFLAISYVVGWIADYAICKGLLKMEDYRFQDYAAMLEGGMDNDILIMGNSRGKSHFDPSIIDTICNVSSFCLGAGGYPINVQLMKFHLYLEHNRKPDAIIQNADYMTIATMDDIRHQHQSEQFFPLVYDKLARKELKKLGYGFFELNVPFYRMFGYQMVIKNGLMEALKLKHYVSCPAYKGHRPEDGEWNGEELNRSQGFFVEMPDSAKKMFEDYLLQ